MSHPSARTLHLCAHAGHELEMRQCLASGCHPDRWFWEGEVRMTPLHMACHRGQLECARLLLEAGADPDLPVDVSGRPLTECANGFTSWQLALGLRDKVPLELTDRPDLQRLLLSHGALPRHELHEGLLARDEALANQHQLARQRRELRREWGREALRAAWHGLETGRFELAADQAREARRLLGDEPAVLRVLRAVEEVLASCRLEAGELAAECRRRLRLEPTSRTWLQALLRSVPGEELPPGLVEELAGLLRSLGMEQELPEAGELADGLDDLPDCCVTYLARRLT